MMNDILNQEDWIIEGVYYSWLSKSFEEADQIIILDIPSSIYKVRIIKRFIKRKVGLEKGKKETLKSLFNLLKWTDQFQNTNLPEVRKIVTPYWEKVVILSSVEEVNNFICKMN